MSGIHNRRSQSVEEKPQDDGINNNNGKMFKSASNQNLKAGGNTFKSFRGKSSVLNRPGTIAALSSLSLGGFSQNISANALRNSHSQWSFSKAERFQKLRIDNSAKMLLLPSTLGNKTSTFGYGEKKPLQMIFGKDSPAPSMYRTRSQFELNPNKGKSIGESYACYKKVHMPGLNTRQDEIPGPGNYDSKTTLGTNSRHFTLKSRTKPTEITSRHNPPPNTYNPAFQLTEPSKFEKITFGFGSRPNVTGRINENPGPGTYKLPSAFDKFKRIPNSSLLKTLEKYRGNGRRKLSKKAIPSRRASSNADFDDPNAQTHEPLAIREAEESNNDEKESITEDDEIE
jgi:hypothetical protein